MKDNNIILKDLLDKIDNNEIILPDFQRDYVWIKDDDKIVEFIASVLSQLPLGNIITFKDSFKSFANKEIGFNKKVSFDDDDRKVAFLLDGQQRVTTLSLVFSDRIFGKIKKYPNLYSPKDLVQKDKIRRRYFLQLPKLYNDFKDADNIDLFGLKTLFFPFKSTSKVPFCSYELIDCINMETFTFTSNDKNKDLWYYPTNENYDNSEFKNKIINNAANEFRIPLYLLTDHIDIVDDILEQIALKYYYNIKRNYTRKNIDGIKACIKENNKIFDLVIDSLSDEEIYYKFYNTLNTYKSDWQKNMRRYLTKCVEEINLLEIDVTDESPARAINMYEALNRGGAKLTTYDLIIARAASAESDNSISYAEKNKNIISTYCNERIFSMVAKNTGISNWNSKDYMQTINRNGEIAPIIINQFLNLLCFVANNANSDKTMPERCLSKISNDCCKAKAQLNLDPNKIVDFSPLVMKSIIDAIMILQFRCGIYSVSQIDYNLLLFPLAYIMYLYESQTVLTERLENLIDLVCGLFLYCTFTGEYAYDQSTVVMKHLEWVHNWVVCDEIPYPFSNKNQIKDSIDEMVLNVPKYNDFNILIFENDQSPKKAVKNSILHYGLSKRPYDFISGEVEKKLAAYKKELEFEIHHMIPLAAAKTLKESTKQLRDKNHILNSPLNLALISKEANRYISSMKIREYKDILSGNFINDYNLPLNMLDFNFDIDDDANNEELVKIFKHRYVSLRGEIIKLIKKNLEIDDE